MDKHARNGIQLLCLFDSDTEYVARIFTRRPFATPALIVGSLTGPPLLAPPVSEPSRHTDALS